MNSAEPSQAAAARARVTIIVARARNGVIGRDNGLPWHLPEDLRHFRETTLGHPVVMGRRTFESIGRPLPGRRNIVVTRDPGWSHPGCDRAASLTDAFASCAGSPEVFVIGGAQLYAQALDDADRLIVTEVDIDADGDARFPAPDPRRWRPTASRPGRSANGLGYVIVTYERIRENRCGGPPSC
jgi:dihydrofolate reductase